MTRLVLLVQCVAYRSTYMIKETDVTTSVTEVMELLRRVLPAVQKFGLPSEDMHCDLEKAIGLDDFIAFEKLLPLSELELSRLISIELLHVEKTDRLF